jgi:hypothetical protein
MSKEHLLDAYLRGEISRRRFIHGLVATGVSLSAATAYSSLVPQRALAAGGSYDLKDESEPPPAKSPPPPKPDPSKGARRAAPAITLQASRPKRRRVRATISCDVPADVIVAVFAGDERFGRKHFRLRSAAVKTVKVKLKRGAPRELTVVATATDAAGRPSTARVLLD